jgi:hypothetical protein
VNCLHPPAAPRRCQLQLQLRRRGVETAGVAAPEGQEWASNVPQSVGQPPCGNPLARLLGEATGAQRLSRPATASRAATHHGHVVGRGVAVSQERGEGGPSGGVLMVVGSTAPPRQGTTLGVPAQLGDSQAVLARSGCAVCGESCVWVPTKRGRGGRRRYPPPLLLVPLEPCQLGRPRPGPPRGVLPRPRAPRGAEVFQEPGWGREGGQPGVGHEPGQRRNRALARHTGRQRADSTYLRQLSVRHGLAVRPGGGTVPGSR